MGGKIAYICLSDAGNLIIGRLIEIGYEVDIIKSKSDIKLIDEKESIRAVIVHVSSEKACEIDIASNIKLSLGLENVKYIVITQFTFRDVIKNAIEIGATDILTDLSNPEQIVKKIKEVAGVVNLKSDSEYYIDMDFILLSFSELVSRELKAAARGGYELSVVSLYPVTDMGLYTEATEDFLNSLKVVLINSLRDTDYVFIQGKQIVVLLPFADEEGCKIVIDRLKEAYKSHPALKPVNKYTDLYSSSATFPEDGRTVEKLFEKVSSETKLLIG